LGQGNALTLAEQQALFAWLVSTGKFAPHVTELLLTAAATPGDVDEVLPDILREHLRWRDSQGDV
jgi:hypothetical protein